jgi:hypothetical protein
MLAKTGVALFLALSSFALGATNAKAQWVPLQAKIRTTVEITRNGATTKTTRTGVIYRSGDGSALTVWDKSGTDAVTGEMKDNKNLHLYKINFTNHTAAEMAVSYPKPTLPDEILQARNSKLGDDFVDGVRCRKAATLIAWPGETPEKIGETCTSLEYALEIRHDYNSTHDSITTHDLTEVYDIVAGKEPDASLFDVTRFTVYQPTHP